MSRSGRRLKHLLLVLVSIASVSGSAFAWEPFNLTAKKIDGNDGFNSLEISWDPGECGRIDKSAITVIGNNVVRNQTVKTARGLATFYNCEYWTRYEIIFRAGLACLDQELHTFIQTGPGQPHRPKDFKVAPHATSAEFTIVEALMPREVSGYNLQLCRTDIDTMDRCKPETFVNHTATDGLQNGTFVDLEPESAYECKVTPIIIDGSKIYEGLSLTGSFHTTQFDYPLVVNFSAQYEERNSTLSAALTWEISRPDLLVESYWITMEPCVANCTRTVVMPAVGFTNLGFSSNIRFEILAMFSVGRKIRFKTFFFNLTTPNYIAPIGALDVARISPTEAYVGWAPTEERSEYEIAICNATECVFRRQDVPEIHLTAHQPGALYDVEIEVHQENFTAEYFKGPLQMLVKDYEAPEIVSTEVEQKLWNRVIYTMQTSIAEDASSLEIEACNSDTTRADCSRVEAENSEKSGKIPVRLSLDYFSSYEVKATVKHELPLGKEVRKSSHRTMSTVGTNPSAVQDLDASEITSNSVDLRWQPPQNIPKPMPAFLTISYEISTESRNWTTTEPTLSVPNLNASTEYVFNVRANVTYLTQVYLGTAAHARFKTDAGRPGKVENLRVFQRVHSPNITVTWDPPTETRGEIQYYELDYGSFGSDPISRRVPVRSTHTTLVLPVTQEDTAYLFRIAAVTFNSKSSALVGDFAELNVTVPGIGLTFKVSLIGRNSSSLELLFESSEDHKEPTNHFFTVTDYKNKTIKSSSNIVNVTNLRVYRDELLRVHACFEDDFCTEEKQIEALTDVDAPSAVVGLKATVSNRTNVQIVWHEPSTKNGPIDGYVVDVVDETDSAVRLNFTVGNVTRFTYNSSDEFERVRISVRAFNNHVNDTSKKVYGPAVTARVRTSGFSVPKVENLRITTVNATSVELDWDKAETDAGSNGILYKVGTFGNDHPELTTQNLSATISGLEAFKNFSVGVRTCIGDRSNLTCGFSRKIYGRTDSAAPSPPRNLTKTILDDNTVALSWERPESSNGILAGYILSIRNSTQTVVNSLNSSIEYYKCQKLNPSEKYHCEVVAFVFNTHSQRLESGPAVAEFSTGHSSDVGIGVLLVGLILLVVATLGYVLWRRTKRAVPYESISPDP